MPTGPCGRLYTRGRQADICERPAGHGDQKAGQAGDPEHHGRHTGVKWVGGRGDTQVVTNLDTVGLDEPAA